MGYNTVFEGELLFIHELRASDIVKLNNIFGEDIREHPEWNAPSVFYSVDLVFNDDYTGIKWDDETEKTYGMVDVINWLMEYTGLQLTGELRATGEDAGDLWTLKIVNGKAIREDKIVLDSNVCPHCGKEITQINH